MNAYPTVNEVKILVLGASGMLGHKIVQRLSKQTDRLWWTLHGGTNDRDLDPVPVLRSSHAIPKVDAIELDAVEALLRSHRPDVTINCIGVVKQRPQASDPVLSITINALLPHRLARTAATWGGRLIHISTDCVFSGRRGKYTEADEPDAPDLYGRTKAMGEVNAPNAVTLRTSLIGRELRNHKSLLDWFLSQRHKRVSGYRKVLWSGVTTLHLANVIEWLILEQPDLSGIYHVSSGCISKFDLLQRLRAAYDLDVEIVPDDTVQRDLSLLGRTFETATGYQCPPWQVLIDELVADPTPYPVLA